jgi:uncharacterized CHY-type Zn-finger protein
MEKKEICTLCKKEITKEQISYEGSVILCKRCDSYLNQKYKRRKRCSD